ncbi:MAG: hypothetical protein NTW79_00070 [Candidatus Berkelbacteria bacterium]|nr:hypothetical protein [Candidatus Berkelbacteria bacterium]
MAKYEARLVVNGVVIAVDPINAENDAAVIKKLPEICSPKLVPCKPEETEEDVVLRVYKLGINDSMPDEQVFATFMKLTIVLAV